MTRLASLWIGIVAVAALASAGCSKPSEADCRKAIANMQRLMGTENLRDEGRIEGEVRRCKGGSKRKAVQCAIKAQTLDDLRHCEFFKVPANAPIGTDPVGVEPPAGSGSAAPAAGSAAPAAGSAGSAAGSGGAAAGTGSASGSAAPTGSAASPGAAAGSAATSPGSAVGSAK